MDTFKILLDLVLIGIGIWMVVTARGLGGVVGKTMKLITTGAIVTGSAHLFATLEGKYFAIGDGWDAVIHRGIVLAGFLLIAAGFRQIQELKM